VDRAGLGRGEEALQDGVEKLAFVGRGEAPLILLEGTGGETFGGESLEGAGGLALEDGRTAGVLLARPGKGGIVGDIDQGRTRLGGSGEIAGGLRDDVAEEARDER
jgi:hypothetical protein